VAESIDKDLIEKENSKKPVEKDADFDASKKILPEQEQKESTRLKSRPDKPGITAEDVMHVLPEAIKLRVAIDHELDRVLEPSIEAGISSSIKKNPTALADTLYPVMGPSIRKAITTTILSMVQSFNQVLENSFTIKGMKWRFEALTTKKPFAEVVLLHTLIYQVEQVFLIHKKTGLVLQHVVSENVVSQDPDLVSSMLTAIQDFVRDSFDMGKDESLDTLKMGRDRNVWIEQGPHAMLAAVIRGTPPEDVRNLLRDTLDDIQLQENDALASFDGDTAPFESVGYHLDSCLQFQTKPPKGRRTPAWMKFLVILFIAAGTWLFLFVQDYLRWTNFVESLYEEPGIVATYTMRRSGKYYAFGVRDPMAPDPTELLQRSHLESQDVVLRFKPYYSMDPEFILIRSQKILAPPETVNLEFKDSILVAQGAALHQWIVAAQKMARAIPGVAQYVDEQVLNINLVLQTPESVTLEQKGRAIYASGSALHQWILDARKRIKTIPGIVEYQDIDLTDIDRDIDAAKENIEKQIIFFKLPGISLVPGQENTFNGLFESIRALNQLAKKFNKALSIDIVGHTDNSGREEENVDISLRRAEAVYDILDLQGLYEIRFIPIGVGSKEPLREVQTVQDIAYNRSVTFKVTISENE
jgi:outer membrane protein OmpA-like peptidoglycan-associated protein